jgi:hypothetical protein
MDLKPWPMGNDISISTKLAWLKEHSPAYYTQLMNSGAIDGLETVPL